MSIENPPAFPEVPGDFNAYEGRSGMTLRDWFAGQVIASAAALPYGHEDYANRARIAYYQADAMLAARGAS